MKFIWKIVAIIVCVALVDSTPLDDDPFAHEKCCPWTSKCRCPIERPPVFENPWICINGTMRHSNSATNSSVNYDIYYDAEAYNDT